MPSSGSLHLCDIVSLEHPAWYQSEVEHHIWYQSEVGHLALKFWHLWRHWQIYSIYASAPLKSHVHLLILEIDGLTVNVPGMLAFCGLWAHLNITFIICHDGEGGVMRKNHVSYGKGKSLAHFNLAKLKNIIREVDSMEDYVDLIESRRQDWFTSKDWGRAAQIYGGEWARSQQRTIRPYILRELIITWKSTEPTSLTYASVKQCDPNVRAWGYWGKGQAKETEKRGRSREEIKEEVHSIVTLRIWYIDCYLLMKQTTSWMCNL